MVVVLTKTVPTTQTLSKRQGMKFSMKFFQEFFLKKCQSRKNAILCPYFDSFRTISTVMAHAISAFLLPGLA